MKHLKNLEEINEQFPTGLGRDDDDMHYPQTYENPLHNLIKDMESLSEMKKIFSYEQFLNERTHTKDDAETVLNIIHKNISTEASLIGGFGKGKETSEHDIDILIPNTEFNNELKDKLFNILNAESVEDTDWGGWYFNNTDFGDVDIFYTTKDFDN
jgi:predicted nucleotidyltransferase